MMFELAIKDQKSWVAGESDPTALQADSLIRIFSNHFKRLAWLAPLLPVTLFAAPLVVSDFPQKIECAASRRVEIDLGRLVDSNASVYKPTFELRNAGQNTVIYQRVFWHSAGGENAPMFLAYSEHEGDYHVVHLNSSGTNYSINLKKGTYVSSEGSVVDEETAKMIPATASANGSIEEGRCTITWNP